MGKLNKKIISRLIVIQFLYQKFFLSSDITEYNQLSVDFKLKESLDFLIYVNQDSNLVWDYISTQKEQKLTPNVKYFINLISLIINNLSYIDDVIYYRCKKKHSQIDPLIIAILRPAICELKYITDIPFKVVINEYTNLANNLLDHYHVGFVNFVLDSYAQQELKN